MSGEAHLTCLDATFYRMKFARDAAAVLQAASAPEGRFHYDGQSALYLSATADGTVVATRRYMTADDPERQIFPLRVVSNRIVDLRDPVATRHFDIDVTDRPVEWQAWRQKGLRAPTWVISDRVRSLGLHGMLYMSRSDPTLTHLTLFAWNTPEGASVSIAEPPMNWPATV